MAQNILHSAWSEKIAHCLDEELDDSARKNNSAGRRSFNSTENDNLLSHTVHSNDNGFVPNVNLSEETTFQRRTRGNRYLAADEVEYDTRNLTVKHSPSSDTVYSRGSRNFSHGSPPGSYRSTRNSSVLNTHSARREVNKDGINVIMLIGFAIGIAFGTLFNITEVYLKWIQVKITDMQLRIYGGKTIQEFYAQEESIAKKMLYGPFSGFFVFLQSLVYVVLISLNFLQKPAPKTLVSNVMMRYMNE